MNSRLFISILLAISMIATSAFAGTVWRVDSNTSNYADFRTLQEAHDDFYVQDGDTLYVAGGSYGSMDLTRPLHIVGPGYFLGENPDTQANLAAATTGTFAFKSGSEGSSMTGMSSSSVHIYTDRIIIKRNHLSNVQINCSFSNTMIIQNYISGGINVCGGSATVIANNLIICSSTAISMNSTPDAVIQNNVISGNLHLYNSNYYNNIHVSGEFSATGVHAEKNISHTDTDISTVFIETGSTDGKWQLAENSPAADAGLKGTDCGAFGGESSYVLSGIPAAIPTICHVDAPAAGSSVSGLPVHIRVKSRN